MLKLAEVSTEDNFLLCRKKLLNVTQQEKMKTKCQIWSKLSKYQFRKLVNTSR